MTFQTWFKFNTALFQALPRSKTNAETAMARTKVEVLLATPRYKVPTMLMMNLSKITTRNEYNDGKKSFEPSCRDVENGNSIKVNFYHRYLIVSNFNNLPWFFQNEFTIKSLLNIEQLFSEQHYHRSLRVGYIRPNLDDRINKNRSTEFVWP